MFITQTRTPPESPVRFLGLGDDTPSEPVKLERLKPWALLERLRPAKLQSLAGRLRYYDRTVDALLLLAQHFPEALKEYDTLTYPVWWEILAHLLNLAEEMACFQVDWEDLNQAWACWMEDSEEEGDHLAAFLKHLPVKLYGFTTESVLRCPPLELIYVLLSGKAEVISSDLLIALEIYDGLEERWGEAERQAAWARLHGIEEDPGRYPEPVRWLPELARWACRNTGNPILDLPPPAWNEGPQLQQQPIHHFAWDDLEQIQSAWRRARPIIFQLDKLKDWVQQDETRLVLLFNFFTEGTYDQLDW